MSTKTILSTPMKIKAIRHQISATRDLNTASTTSTWTITGLHGENLSSDYIIGMYGKISVQFAGITGPVWMEIGDSSTSDLMMMRINLMSEIAENQPLFTNFDLADARSVGTVTCGRLLNNYRFNPTAPIITFTSSSGNLSGLTAGEVEIIVVSLVPE